MSTPRERLPNRRASEVFQFRHEGHSYTASVSRFPDGRPAEVFLDTAKAGSAIQAHAQDSAVLVSLALQFGIDPLTIAHSLAGPIATALKLAIDRSSPPTAE
jgi:hypothetical protein